MPGDRISKTTPIGSRSSASAIVVDHQRNNLEGKSGRKELTSDEVACWREFHHFAPFFGNDHESTIESKDPLRAEIESVKQEIDASSGLDSVAMRTLLDLEFRGPRC